MVHSLLFEDSRKITSWSKKLPQNKLGNSYLNFIASHDGIGIRPTEGILNNNTLKKYGSKPILLLWLFIHEASF